MMTISVSGVFPVFQVGLRYLTQLQPTSYAGFCTRVSGVSGLSRVQACTRTLKRAFPLTSIHFLMREEKPNTPDTPDTVVLKQCFIWVFSVLGLCQVEGFLCWVRFFGETGR